MVALPEPENPLQGTLLLSAYSRGEDGVILLHFGPRFARRTQTRLQYARQLFNGNPMVTQPGAIQFPLTARASWLRNRQAAIEACRQNGLADEWCASMAISQFMFCMNYRLTLPGLVPLRFSRMTIATASADDEPLMVAREIHPDEGPVLAVEVAGWDDNELNADNITTGEAQLFGNVTADMFGAELLDADLSRFLTDLSEGRV